MYSLRRLCNGCPGLECALISFLGVAWLSGCAVDVLVLNAGIAQAELFKDIRDIDGMRRIMVHQCCGDHTHHARQQNTLPAPPARSFCCGVAEALELHFCKRRIMVLARLVPRPVGAAECRV